VLPQSASALTFSAADSAESCQAECRAAAGDDDGCSYYEWREFSPPGQQCALRKLGLKPPSSFGSEDSIAKVLYLVSGLAAVGCVRLLRARLHR